MASATALEKENYFKYFTTKIDLHVSEEWLSGKTSKN